MVLPEQPVDKKFLAEFGVLVAKKILKLDELDILLMFKQPTWFHNNDVTATFLRDTYIIVYNEEWLENSSDLEIIACSFHEARHAYQQAQIDFREQLEIQEPIETVDKWKVEIGCYKKSTGDINNDTEYLMQEIEIDATAFEQFLIKELFNVEPDVYFEIKDEIISRLAEYKVLIENIDLPRIDLSIINYGSD